MIIIKDNLTHGINAKFDEKLRELNKFLPTANPAEGGCAEITLTSILEILGIQGGVINNTMIPLSSGFGGYKSQTGQAGPCGVVCGGCAAIGVILGGKEKMESNLVPLTYQKASAFCSEFEKAFGSIFCPDLCRYDFSDPKVMVEYIENNIWGDVCYKFVIWAVDKVRNMMQKELEENW